MNCDDPVGWWMRFVLNLVAGVLFGVAYTNYRRAKRLYREIVEWRTVTDHLQRLAHLLGERDAFPRHDDDPPDPSPLH